MMFLFTINFQHFFLNRSKNIFFWKMDEKNMLKKLYVASATTTKNWVAILTFLAMELKIKYPVFESL